MASKLADKMIKSYAADLAKVMGQLELELISFAKGADAAATILNSRGNFIQSLQSSGYNDLAEQYVSQYGQVPGQVSKAFAARKLPPPRFSTVSAETFSGLARIDLEAFEAIGTKAMEDLRIGMYKQVIGGADFKSVVETIKASTVGLGKNGSPLSNYSTTHANTAILNFNGEVTREAGESIGFGGDESLWELVHVIDSRTRDICLSAFEKPIRTRAEWISIDYFGGSPGGFN